MPRLAILASLAALTLGAAAASAQESGGVALTPEVLATENAQGRVLDHVLARAQQLQQLRLLNLSGGAAVSSNLANPAFAPPNGDPRREDERFWLPAADHRQLAIAHGQQLAIAHGQQLAIAHGQRPRQPGQYRQQQRRKAASLDQHRHQRQRQRDRVGGREQHE
jgi:hypothetical protein